MSFLLFLLVLVGWLYLYSRLRRAEDRIEDESHQRIAVITGSLN
jgi:uncharacterized membrane protein